MKKTISEIAKLSGVSVRTLHYYDEIGLLKPSEVIDETGYRYYDEEDELRLQQILFYRELDFSLKDIKKIMFTSTNTGDIANSVNTERKKALAQQKHLLQLKRDRLDRLIQLLDNNLKGDVKMSFKEFDTTEIDEAKDKYAAEVEQRWGETDAYAQSKKKTAKYSKEDWSKVNEGMDALLEQFSKHIGEKPDAPQVQALVVQWQQFITDTYYDCTKAILAGLGQMYIADERFTKNMDKFAQGTAQLISDAIAEYCK